MALSNNPTPNEVVKSVKNIEANYVTTNTVQTISAKKTFSSSPVLNNNVFLRGKMTAANDVPLIGVNSGNSIVIGNSSNVNMIDGDANPSANNTYDLGSSSLKWKDLYLSGNVTDGTTTKTIAEILAGGGGGSVSIDNTSITENSSNQIQTVGVIDQKTGNANKQWTGTKAEYDALGTHDANTFYNITDDNGGLGSQIVTLYDKDITAVNLGYSSGIPSSTEFTLDLTGYKFIKIYYQMYFGAAYNTGGNCNILELGVHTTETWNIAHGNPFYYDQGTIRLTQFAIDYRFNTSTKKNTVYFFNGGAEATSGSAYHIFRIEGVK